MYGCVKTCLYWKSYGFIVNFEIENTKTPSWKFENAQNSGGAHVRSFTPPKSLKKHASASCYSKNLEKNSNISLEVSSSLFVLQHLCTNIKISLPEITISRRRLNKSLNIAKSTFHETIKTAADQWTTTENSCYSYSNTSTIIVEQQWFRWYSLGFISKRELTKNQ